MKPRLSEREVLSTLLKHLDLPFRRFELDRTSPVVSLFLSPSEWEEVRALVAKTGVDEIGEAWRELHPSVWTDEYWINRVCVRVCQFAGDYEKLFQQPVSCKNA